MNEMQIIHDINNKRMTSAIYYLKKVLNVYDLNDTDKQKLQSAVHSIYSVLSEQSRYNK